MALLNSSFEEAGPAPGTAANWTLVTFVAAERVAGFGPSPVRGREDFERWSELKLAFGAGDLSFALLDLSPEPREDFDEAWDNDLYLGHWPAGQEEAAVFDSDPIDRFERGWDNDSFAFDWNELVAAAGVFDNEPREDFEDAWPGPDVFVTDWSAVSSDAARFSSSSPGHDDFEGDWPAATTI